MFRGKDLDNISNVMKHLEKKIDILEGYLNKEKKVYEKRLQDLEKTCKDQDNKLGSTRVQLEGANKKIEEITKQTKNATEKTSSYTGFQKDIKKQLNDSSTIFKGDIEKLQSQFSDFENLFESFKNELEQEKQFVEERDKEIVKLEAKIKEQEILLKEKAGRISKLDKELAGITEKIGKTQTERAGIEGNLQQIASERDESKKKFKALQTKYEEIKTKIGPSLSQNENIRKILKSSDEGRIYLELEKATPKILTIDELAERLDKSAVILKTILISMHEISVLEFDPVSRKITLN